MEPTIKLDVVGIHLLCLGLTRGFNKNNFKKYTVKSIIYTVSLEYKVTPKVQRIQGCH